jgi:tight adherence protein B
MDVRYYLFVVLAFLSVAMLVEGLFTLWKAHRGPTARQIARRLEAMAEGETSQEGPLLKQRKLSRIPALDRALQAMPYSASVDRWLRQSGLSLNLIQLLGLVVAAAAAGALLGWFVRLPGFLVPAAAVLGGSAPVIWLVSVCSQRLSRIDQQLPDVMDLMSRALRAGHSFSSALQMAASEGPEPTAREFRIAFDEISFGIPVPDALKHLAERVPSNDLRFLVVAVITQRETGGNLAELLTTTATLIRGRHRLLGAVRVLATEGKFSAWILVILPFVLAVALHAANPDFMNTLWTDPVGVKVAIGALLAMMVGIVWMWRVVKIRI